MPMSPRLLRPRAGGGIDPDVLAFQTASGATDLSAVNAVVRYLRNQGLLSSSRFYPMKSAQNAGTGSTVYGIGGLASANLTLVNSPTWGASGITFVAASSQQAGATGWPTCNVDSGALLMARITKAAESNSDTFGATNPQTVIALGGPVANNNAADSYNLRVLGGRLDMTYRNSANTGFITTRASTHDIDTQDVVISSLSTTGSNRLFLDNTETGYDLQASGAGRAVSTELLISRNPNQTNGRFFDGLMTCILIVHASATQSQLGTLSTLLKAL